MRIVLHDYSGHPFPIQLSRALAARGHEILHLYSTDFETPKGRLQTTGQDPSRLAIKGLSIGGLKKESLIKRRFQEKAFGRAVAREIESFSPDVVISGNAPLDTQTGVAAAARRAGSAFVFWVQDLYGEAIDRILRRKLGVAGFAVGAWYKGLEYRLLRASDAIVAISADFAPILVGNGVPEERLAIVENWAPLDEIPYRRAIACSGVSRANATRFIYTGTLGYKHNPGLLLDVAVQLGEPLVVYSEGAVARSLGRNAAKAGANLQVRNWLPFSELPDLLASADVLMAIIEPDAGIFSVPSKVLTYFCAGRPILAAIPLENLAARLIVREGAGLVSPPEDPAQFIENARRLAADAALRARMGAAGRSYAERAFDIGPLADRFEQIIDKALARHRRA